jgi:hypothetical protein
MLNGKPTGEYVKGVMKYDGSLVLDTLFSNIQTIETDANWLFIATKPSGEKDLFRLSDQLARAENLTKGLYSDVVYIDGSNFFKVSRNGESTLMNTNGIVVDEANASVEIQNQQRTDFESRVKEGKLNDKEFDEYYRNVLNYQLNTLPAGIREGYGVISVWSPVGDQYFTINNGSFGLTGESRSIKGSDYWAGCNSELLKQVPNLDDKSSTSFIIVPFGQYEVKLTEMEFGTTKVFTTITTYTATVTQQNRCIEVRIH